MRNTIPAFLFLLIVGCGSIKFGELMPKADEGRRQSLSGGSEQIATASPPGTPPKVPTGQCEPGSRMPAEDGCNTCYCGDDGTWGCTEMACVSSETGCVEKLPQGLQAAINLAYKENQARRDVAVASERDRLGVRPLLPTTILKETTATTAQRFKPSVDPFPESVVAVGDSYDIRAEGYEINHGKMGMTRVYETKPGSGSFFIVDQIGGDGIGGNGRSVIAESIEYGLLALTSDAVAGSSWHSWHVDDDNFLVRANQVVEDDLVEELRLCGCGPGGYEVDLPDANKGIAADASMAAPAIAIFMLPGSALPKLGDEDAFQAKFKRTYYKKKYIPKEGKRCMKHEAVC